MMQTLLAELPRVSLSGFFILILSVDLILRWRRRHLPINEVTDWRGLLPLPALAVCGGVASLLCGWVGWGLLVSAAVTATDAMKAPGLSYGIERAICIRSTMIFQAAVLAVLIQRLVAIFT